MVSLGGLGGTRISRQTQPMGQGAGWRLLWEGHGVGFSGTEPGVPPPSCSNMSPRCHLSPRGTAHRSAFPVVLCCATSAAMVRGGEMVCQRRSFIGMAGLLPCSTCHLAPSTLFISGIHMLQVLSEIKREMDYSWPGKGSVDPRSGVLSTNIERGQG